MPFVIESLDMVQKIDGLQRDSLFSLSTYLIINCALLRLQFHQISLSLIF